MPRKANKIKTVMYLEAEQVKALKKVQARWGTPVSELIRRGVDLILKKYPPR
jgi:hypothetical protein